MDHRQWDKENASKALYLDRLGLKRTDDISYEVLKEAYKVKLKLVKENPEEFK